MKAGRLQCKDIADDVFMAAVRQTPSATPFGGWRTTWDVHETLETMIGPVPWNLLHAKARNLEAKGLLGGCTCGCRGDWHAQAECVTGCCHPV